MKARHPNKARHIALTCSPLSIILPALANGHKPLVPLGAYHIEHSARLPSAAFIASLIPQLPGLVFTYSTQIFFPSNSTPSAGHATVKWSIFREVQLEVAKEDVCVTPVRHLARILIGASSSQIRRTSIILRHYGYHSLALLNIVIQCTSLS